MQIKQLWTLALMIGLTIIIIAIDVLLKRYHDEITYSKVLMRIDFLYRSVSYLIAVWLGIAIGHWFMPQHTIPPYLLSPNLRDDKSIEFVNYMRSELGVPKMINQEDDLAQR